MVEGKTRELIDDHIRYRPKVVHERCVKMKYAYNR